MKCEQEPAAVDLWDEQAHRSEACTSIHTSNTQRKPEITGFGCAWSLPDTEARYGCSQNLCV